MYNIGYPRPPSLAPLTTDVDSIPFNDMEYLKTIVFLDQKLTLPLAVALWVRAAKTSRFIYEHLSLVKCKTAENPKPKFWRSSFLRWQRSMSFQGQVPVPVGGVVQATAWSTALPYILLSQTHTNTLNRNNTNRGNINNINNNNENTINKNDSKNIFTVNRSNTNTNIDRTESTKTRA